MMVEMVVQREVETALSITGRLFVSDQFEGFTLEPTRVNPVHVGHPCVPTGRYRVVLSRSPHLGYVTPELGGVPGRSEIRFHVGNFPKDSLGCFLVGENRGEDAVWNSKEAFVKLMALLTFEDEQVGSEIWVTVLDVEVSPPGVQALLTS